MEIEEIRKRAGDLGWEFHSNHGSISLCISPKYFDFVGNVSFSINGKCCEDFALAASKENFPFLYQAWIQNVIGRWSEVPYKDLFKEIEKNESYFQNKTAELYAAVTGREDFVSLRLIDMYIEEARKLGWNVEEGFDIFSNKYTKLSCPSPYKNCDAPVSEYLSEPLVFMFRSQNPEQICIEFLDAVDERRSSLTIHTINAWIDRRLETWMHSHTLCGVDGEVCFNDVSDDFVSCVVEFREACRVLARRCEEINKKAA